MRRLRVERSGPRTTVEDLGRRGVARHGVPAGGAFDPASLAAANRAVDNPPWYAGLEATIEGPTLRNVGDEPLLLAVAGGRLSLPTGDAGTVAALGPDEVLQLERPLPGARAWIAVAGGIDVPIVLGGRGTCESGGFGGLAGRALRNGDELSVGAPPGGDCDPGPRSVETIRALPPGGSPALLRLLPGPNLELWTGDPIGRLEATLWSVSPDSDRTGVRLRPLDPGIGSAIARPPGIAPQGTVLGALQLPPDESAILLGPDRPVTGGYAMPAVLARADLGLLARLRPGDRVRFARMDATLASATFPPPAGSPQGLASRAAPPGRGGGAETLPKIDLNADVGEGFPEDELLPWITSASVACGAHAGDATTMRRTLSLAQARGISIGAHPGFPDREGFGRRTTTRDPEEIERIVEAQIATLAEACRDTGSHLSYAKPHGALYNLASADPEVARAVARAVLRSLPGRPLVLAAGSPGRNAAEREGAKVVAEAFVDRAYRDDGSLVPRSEAGSRIEDPAGAARRALALAIDGRVSSANGREIRLAADTLCLHGDTPGSAAIARAVRRALEGAGVSVAPFAPRLPLRSRLW